VAEEAIMRTKLLTFALSLAVLCTPSAFAGDVLWFLGRSGADEGHVQVVNLLQNEEGAIVDVVGTTPLPTLDGYTLIFIVMPGFTNPSDFFSADEKARLNTWLLDPTHRVVMVGDWDATVFAATAAGRWVTRIRSPQGSATYAMRSRRPGIRPSASPWPIRKTPRPRVPGS
jgi:hypothetical protein